MEIIAKITHLQKGLHYEKNTEKIVTTNLGTS